MKSLILQRSSYLLVFVVISLLLSGCGPGQLFGPTLTPSPTSTPTPTLTPTPLPGPKAGHWEGEPSVSFEIETNGNINNFKIAIALGPTNTCNVTLEEIVVGTDGSFTSIFGEPGVDGANTIQGKFESDTTVSGSYSNSIFCVDPSGQAIFSILVGDSIWNAEWKGQ